MIPYVQSAASQEVPPPYHFPGVKVNAFVWDAPMAAIQKYCDLYFNLRSDRERGFVYKPAAFWPYATLLFLEYPVMISAGRKPEKIGGQVPYSDRGIISQTEVFVAVPVVRYGIGPVRLALESTVEWALPFIVVGNPMSCVCGREMLGMGKPLADIETGESVFPGSFRGSVTLPGWPTLEAGVQQKMMPFLEVTTAPVMPTFRGSVEEDSLWSLLRSREASSMLDSLAGALGAVDDASYGMLPTTMRTVSLKQIRDARHPDRALYQALATCRSAYSNFDNFRFYNERDVDIAFHDQGSFGEILRVFLDLPGAPTGEIHRVKPKAAYSFTADIEFDEMRTIFTFPVDRGPGLAPVPETRDIVSRWLRPWRGFFFGQPPS
ncbi:MAG TPA: hypothetical protein VKS60_09480 [Stellaceae bacterium]|nr:hypothetical protein [Stellaceae bacterium]